MRHLASIAQRDLFPIHVIVDAAELFETLN